MIHASNDQNAILYIIALLQPYQQSVVHYTVLAYHW